MDVLASANPLLPTAYDVVWSVACLAAMVVAIVAIVSIGRTRAASAGFRTAWVLIVLILPVLGALAWFLFGTRRYVRSGTSQESA